MVLEVPLHGHPILLAWLFLAIDQRPQFLTLRTPLRGSGWSQVRNSHAVCDLFVLSQGPYLEWKGHLSRKGWSFSGAWRRVLITWVPHLRCESHFFCFLSLGFSAVHWKRSESCIVVRHFLGASLKRFLLFVCFFQNGFSV